MENKHTMTDLYQMQSLPLSAKIRMTQNRINGWVEEFGEDGVYVSFSGGKDSTVLVDIVRNVCGYKNIPLVFVDVPTQYPELKQFAMTFDNLVILKPKISFAEVCEKYGFPMFSKEISACIADSRKYVKILNERTNERTNEHSVCLSDSRFVGNRKKSRQGKQSVYRFEDGEYP